MAKCKDLRYQSSAVDAPAASVVSLYADNSGVLKVVRPGGDVYFAGQTFTQVLSGNFPGSVATGVTGGAGAIPYLGVTTTLFVVQGPSGKQYGIPAYVIT